MTSAILNQSLIYRTKRKVINRPYHHLTPEECIAINLFWRNKVKAKVLAKVFKVSKNTIYYRSLTGWGESYPHATDTNTAKATNALVEEIGVETAWKEFVTDEMIRAVNAEMAAELERGKPATEEQGQRDPR